jgi:ABC-type dipeptide/oligopeptide/nickel transport system permease subunit
MLSGFMRNLKSFSRSKIGFCGLIIILIFIFIAIFAPVIAPYNPEAKYVGPPLSPPSSKYILGTDDAGRDVFSLIIFASRSVLTISLLAASIGTILGTVIGLLAGYFGGAVDDILMRLTDVFLIIPFIPLAIALTLYFGPSMWNIILLFGFFGWPSAARQVRSQVLSLREALYVEAARAIGASDFYIIFKIILPNVIGIVIANVVMRTVFVITAESGLALIGATDPRNLSWGTLLFYAQRSGAIIKGAWWTFIPPGFCISMLACGFTFFGHGIMWFLNPRLQR